MHYSVACRLFVRISFSQPINAPLSPIFATAVLLNEHSLYEHILDDDVFMGVVGILECPWIKPAYPM